MGKVIAGIIALLVATAYFSIFIVKEVNQAIVLQFGDPKKIISQPGINFKIPFIQNVVFLDKRILNLDCLLYTSPSPRDVEESRMPSSA